MDTITEMLASAQRCLDGAKIAAQKGDAATMLQRLALVAQYASLIADDTAHDTLGRGEMMSVWSAANKVSCVMFPHINAA